MHWTIVYNIEKNWNKNGFNILFLCNTTPIECLPSHQFSIWPRNDWLLKLKDKLTKMLSGLKFCLLFFLYHVHLSIFQVKSLEIQECTLVHKEANTGKHSAAATCLYRKYKQIHNLSLHFSLYKNAKSVSRVLLYLEYSKV